MARAAVRAVAFVVLAVTVPACGATSASGPSPDARPGVVRILMGGDVMLGRGVADVVAHDPWSIFADIQTEVRSADIAIANLESPLTPRPHIAATPNALEADPGAARSLAGAGFGAVSIANNHAGDAGPGGIADTLAALRAVGVLPLGGGLDAAQATAPTMLVRNGVRVALLSFDATLQAPPATTPRPASPRGVPTPPGRWRGPARRPTSWWSGSTAGPSTRRDRMRTSRASRGASWDGEPMWCGRAVRTSCSPSGRRGRRRPDGGASSRPASATSCSIRRSPGRPPARCWRCWPIATA